MNPKIHSVPIFSLPSRKSEAATAAFDGTTPPDSTMHGRTTVVVRPSVRYGAPSSQASRRRTRTQPPEQPSAMAPQLRHLLMQQAFAQSRDYAIHINVMPLAFLFVE
jgi:hypothetical protein